MLSLLQASTAELLKSVECMGFHSFKIVYILQHDRIGRKNSRRSRSNLLKRVTVHLLMAVWSAITCCVIRLLA